MPPAARHAHSARAGKDLRFVNRGPFQLDGFKDHIILHEAVWDENAPIEDAPVTEPPRPEGTGAEEGTGEPAAGKTAEQPVAAEPARAPDRQASPPAAEHAHTAQADKEAGP